MDQLLPYVRRALAVYESRSQVVSLEGTLGQFGAALETLEILSSQARFHKLLVDFNEGAFPMRLLGADPLDDLLMSSLPDPAAAAAYNLRKEDISQMAAFAGRCARARPTITIGVLAASYACGGQPQQPLRNEAYVGDREVLAVLETASFTTQESGLLPPSLALIGLSFRFSVGTGVEWTAWLFGGSAAYSKRLDGSLSRLDCGPPVLDFIGRMVDNRELGREELGSSLLDQAGFSDYLSAVGGAVLSYTEDLYTRCQSTGDDFCAQFAAVGAASSTLVTVFMSAAASAAETQRWATQEDLAEMRSLSGQRPAALTRTTTKLHAMMASNDTPSLSWDNCVLWDISRQTRVFEDFAASYHEMWPKREPRFSDYSYSPALSFVARYGKMHKLDRSLSSLAASARKSSWIKTSGGSVLLLPGEELGYMVPEGERQALSTTIPFQHPPSLGVMAGLPVLRALGQYEDPVVHEWVWKLVKEDPLNLADLTGAFSRDLGSSKVATREFTIGEITQAAALDRDICPPELTILAATCALVRCGAYTPAGSSDNACVVKLLRKLYDVRANVLPLPTPRGVPLPELPVKASPDGSLVIPVINKLPGLINGEVVIVTGEVEVDRSTNRAGSSRVVRASPGATAYWRGLESKAVSDSITGITGAFARVAPVSMGHIDIAVGSAEGIDWALVGGLYGL